ncbi:hypothetical protein C6P42_003125 [Pichia californica]|nr:hypothetical protein C6P42_003125 [[Candida] californica]
MSPQSQYPNTPFSQYSYQPIPPQPSNNIQVSSLNQLPQLSQALPPNSSPQNSIQSQNSNIPSLSSYQNGYYLHSQSQLQNKQSSQQQQQQQQQQTQSQSKTQSQQQQQQNQQQIPVQVNQYQQVQSYRHQQQPSLNYQQQYTLSAPPIDPNSNYYYQPMQAMQTMPHMLSQQQQPSQQHQQEQQQQQQQQQSQQQQQEQQPEQQQQQQQYQEQQQQLLQRQQYTTPATTSNLPTDHMYNYYAQQPWIPKNNIVNSNLPSESIKKTQAVSPPEHSPLPQSRENYRIENIKSVNDRDDHFNRAVNGSRIEKTNSLPKKINNERISKYFSRLNESGKGQEEAIKSYLNYYSDAVNLSGELLWATTTYESIQKFQNYLHKNNTTQFFLDEEKNLQMGNSEIDLKNYKIQEFYKYISFFPKEELIKLSLIFSRLSTMFTNWANLQESNLDTNLNLNSFMDKPMIPRINSPSSIHTANTASTTPASSISSAYNTSSFKPIKSSTIPGESVSLQVIPVKLISKQDNTVKFNTQGTLQPDLSMKVKLSCQHCGSTSTPEWRKGPEEARTLCNACGLFHTKLVKKLGSEGAAKELKRRKDAGEQMNRRI